MIERYAKALYDAGCQREVDIELRRNYAGRGTGGQQTTAVVIDRMQTLFPLIVLVTEGLGDEGTAEFVDVCAGLRTDTMGRGVIIY
jgi:hypothetical protein